MPMAEKFTITKTVAKNYKPCFLIHVDSAIVKKIYWNGMIFNKYKCLGDKKMLCQYISLKLNLNHTLVHSSIKKALRRKICGYHITYFNTTYVCSMTSSLS